MLVLFNWVDIGQTMDYVLWYISGHPEWYKGLGGIFSSVCCKVALAATVCVVSWCGIVSVFISIGEALKVWWYRVVWRCPTVDLMGVCSDLALVRSHKFTSPPNNALVEGGRIVDF